MACVPETIQELVGRFARDRDAYVSGGITETQLRREFIDPLFETLGWAAASVPDAARRHLPSQQASGPWHGSGLPHRDVIFDDSVKVGATGMNQEWKAWQPIPSSWRK